MKLFQAVCLGFDGFKVKSPIPKGALCSIRLDTEGNIHLVSVNGERLPAPGYPMNSYELHTYFKLGHGASK